MKISPPRPRGRPRMLDRDEALETALALFWRHGYEGTSVADLTQAMGVTAPSLYAAFGSKEQLYRDALNRYGATHSSFVTRALKEEASAEAAFKRLLTDAIALYAGGERPPGCMLTTAMVQCAADHAGLAAEVAGRRDAATTLLKGRLDQAVAEGELPATTDTKALAHFFAAIVQGIAIQARDGVSPAILAQIADTAMRAWPGMEGPSGA